MNEPKLSNTSSMTIIFASEQDRDEFIELLETAPDPNIPVCVPHDPCRMHMSLVVDRVTVLPDGTLSLQGANITLDW